MSKHRDHSAPSAETPISKGDTGSPRYQSQALFGGRREILIEHGGHAYRLRITRQDKLILTK